MAEAAPKKGAKGKSRQAAKTRQKGKKFIPTPNPERTARFRTAAAKLMEHRPFPLLTKRNEKGIVLFKTPDLYQDPLLYQTFKGFDNHDQHDPNRRISDIKYSEHKRAFRVDTHTDGKHYRSYTIPEARFQLA